MKKVQSSKAIIFLYVHVERFVMLATIVMMVATMVLGPAQPALAASKVAILAPPPELERETLAPQAPEANMTISLPIDEMTSPGFGCSLREAIFNANVNNNSTYPECDGVGFGNDTISLSIGSGIIALNPAWGPLVISDTAGLTIHGGSCIVSGQNATQVIRVIPGASVTLNMVQIRFGRAANGGGIYNNGGTVILNSSAVANNTATNAGGGIYNANGTVNVQYGSVVRNNTATGGGGGIYVAAGTVNVNSGSVIGQSGAPNQAQSGGGILNSNGSVNIGDTVLGPGVVSYNRSTVNGGGIHNARTLNVQNNSFIQNNAANTNGGGIYNVFPGVVMLDGSTVSSNTSDANVDGTGNGGGIYNNVGTVTVDAGSHVDGNTDNTGGGGGGIYNTGGAVIVRGNSTVNNNTTVAGNGGGLYSASTLVIDSSTIQGNDAVNGGGVYNNDLLTVTLSYIASNDASNDGGGIYHTNNGIAQVADTTIDGNVADSDTSGAGSGGGFYNNSGTLTVDGVTLSGNDGGNAGGGVYGNAGTVSLINSTVSGNDGGADGGSLYNLGATVSLANSVVANNLASVGGGGIHNLGTVNLRNTAIGLQAVGVACVNSGALNSQGYNLASDDTCNLTQSTDLSGVDPLLNPLADNGGPVNTSGAPALTHLPQSTSPLIDTSPCDLAIDQRNVPRPLGWGCDMGPLESTGPAVDLAVIKTGPLTVTAGSAFSYTIEVYNGGDKTANGVVLTDTLPYGVSYLGAFTASGGVTCPGAPATGQVTCTLPNIITGTTVSVILGVEAAADICYEGKVNNYVEVFGDEPEWYDPANNRAEWGTVILNNTSLAIDKAVTPATVSAGELITFTLTVTNAGNGCGAGVVVVDELQNGLEQESVVAPAYSCSNGVCMRSTDMLSGTVDTIVIAARAPASLAAGSYDNTAVAIWDSGTVSGTASFTVQAWADVSLDKVDLQDPVGATGGFLYELVVSNAGPSDAQGVQISDTLDADVSYAGASAGCSHLGGVVTCAVGALGAGETRSYLIAVRVGDVVSGTVLTNNASVSSATADPAAGNNSDAETTTVQSPAEPEADVGIVKAQITVNPIDAGSTVAYRLSVSNAGPQAATEVQSHELIPAGTTIESITSSQGACSLSGLCALGTLASGVSALVTVTLRIDADYGAGNFINQAYVVASEYDSNAGDNLASAGATAVQALADLSIDKSGSITASAGESLEYTIVVSNTGPSDAQNVQVTDNLPASLLNISVSVDDMPAGTCSLVGNALTCNLGVMTPGEAATIRIMADILSTVTANINNTATAVSSTPGADPSDNHTTVVVASADLALDKAAGATVVAGEAITYTLTVYNAGPSEARGVVVTDTLPAGVSFGAASGGCGHSGGIVTCTVANLSGGGAAVFTLTVMTDAALAPGTSLENAAEARSATPDGELSDNYAAADTSVISEADLGLSKSGPGSVIAGQSITYTLVLINGGPSVAQSVEVVDNWPVGASLQSAAVARSGSGPAQCGGTVCGLGGVAVGEVVTITLVGLVDLAAAEGSTLANVATAFTGSADPNPANNTGSVVTMVNTEADLWVDKIDLSDSVQPAEGFIYQITVANQGPSAAQGVIVTDTLGSNITFAAVSPGCAGSAGSSVITCTISVLLPGSSQSFLLAVIAGDVPHGTVLSNTVQVASSTYDAIAGNNDDIEYTTVQQQVGPSADLGLSKTASPGAVIAGEKVTYTLTITNAGPSTAYNVQALELIPADTTVISIVADNPDFGYEFCTLSGVCYLGTVYTSTVALVTTVLRVNPDYAGSSLTNLASVSGDQIDNWPDNNIGAATVMVTTWADLELSKTDLTDPVISGEVLVYQLSAANLGPSDAQNVVVTDAVPLNTTFVGASAFCAESGGVITCMLGVLPAGETGLASIQVRVSQAVLDGTLITNTAYASAANGNDDSATAATQVVQSPLNPTDLAIGKYGDPAVVIAGEWLTYTLVVTNNGPAPATSVRVVDMLPAGVTPFSVTPSQGLCHVDLTCDVGDLAVGDAASIVLLVRVNSDQLAALTNVARVSASNLDTNPINNEASVVTGVGAQAYLGISKSAAPNVATPGEHLTYQIVVTNSGPSDARDVVVADTLPAALTGVVLSVSQGNCGGSVCNLGVIPAGQQAVISVIGTVAPDSLASFANIAQVSSATPNLNPNNTASVTTPVLPQADLALDKTATPTADAGETITYTLAVVNYGLSDAQNVLITDTLPISVTFVSASSGCSDASGVVICARSSLAAGDSASFTIVVQVDDGIEPGVSLENVAAVGAATFDNDLTNNQDDADTSIVGVADLVISKTGPAATMVGKQIVYTLIVTNYGPSVSQDVEVKDLLPPGLTLDGVSISRSGVGPLACHGAVCQVGNMAVNEVVTMLITATVNTEYSPDGIVNTGLVLSDTPDNNPGDNSDSHTLTIPKVYLPIVLRIGQEQPQLPDLVVGFSLTPNKSSFGYGELVTVTVFITNVGNTPAGSFWVDFYINPSPVPTQANLQWQQTCTLFPCYGIAWQVPAGLLPGHSIRLTSTPNSYWVDYTFWAGSFAVGTTDLYVYVDSWNPGGPNGAILELDETNNRAERHGLNVGLDYEGEVPPAPPGFTATRPILR